MHILAYSFQCNGLCFDELSIKDYERGGPDVCNASNQSKMPWTKSRCMLLA